MGTYREEIYTPYGVAEAESRIAEWLKGDGNKYKVLGRGVDYIKLKRGVPVNPDIYFDLRLTSEHVRAECWVKGFTKDPISPKAVWGGISRRTGWKDFQTLKDILCRGVDPGAL